MKLLLELGPLPSYVALIAVCHFRDHVSLSMFADHGADLYSLANDWAIFAIVDGPPYIRGATQVLILKVVHRIILQPAEDVWRTLSCLFIEVSIAFKRQKFQHSDIPTLK